ncbi:Exocyst complex component 7 [Phytophthora pseudosyringae]|uniref:Exocyst subunit Exo70 family protein n=1 Tax=Phytophthora pseudosyringae TaxID=221518 RepID=A0A8T1WCY4_9STRA|nr:Exocyst complex component 7 [Phytophthora pseudosyringae]
MEVYGAYGDGVARIREAVLENQLQMRQVEQSLRGFQRGLLGVEREMLPVYKLTEQLRGTQKNIDLSVQQLRQINENFVAAHELAPVLLNGSKFDQDEYVKALQKLLVAIAFLEGHRSYEGSVKALDQAKELLAQVRRKCMADFVSVVSVLSRGERDDDGHLKWIEPSKHDVARAAQLLDCLLLSGLNQTELLREYGNQRFDVIRMFLREDPSGSSMGFDLNNPVTALAKGLKDIEVTIEAEKVLAELIYANEELANGAFRYSAHQVLESWKKDVDLSLHSPKQLDAVKLLLVHDLLLSRLEALEAAVLPPLLLRDREGKGLGDPWVLSKAVNAIVIDLAATAKQKLFNFQPGLAEASGDRTVTRDGNVHPISSHTLNFLRKMCDQAKPLKVLLAKDSDVSSVAFVDTVVTQLIEALTLKADQLKGRDSLKQLFLVNNFGYVANSLPHCPQPDDADLEKQLHGIIKPRVEAMRNDSLGAFIHLSYVSFKEYLKDPTETLQYAKGGNVLTLESGRLLKEKFSKFNDQLEELYKTQRTYVVAEVPIRQHLIRTAVDTIIPAYKAFYEKYSAIQFSRKHASKYLKYTPQAAQVLLKELFSGEVSPGDKRSEVSSS